ncbi:alpha-n-arabinofuranosidase a [Diplodia corticola]|uniref:non-reducing end alpha-L-arabinofuranosidase n=1 Tax=Diplodia corticola TaxID=236234 RepID=A0A1J9RPB5_9PEZI|nr:alpha-n-arabinofuranosidase a [Diplodia corticola]OJD34395.1 alpha-n-arabinofuranosidase a [Diplodia corticola]
MHWLTSPLTRLATGAALVGGASGINLKVATSGGNATSPLMYGFMFEDINHSGDGGISGQLLRNNGFQGDDDNTTAYAPIGDVDLSVDSNNPLTTAIQRSLAVAVPEGATGDVGFSNEGYWGILVNADQYFTSFYVKGAYSGSVTIKLVGRDSGTEFASVTLDVSSNTNDYTYYQTNFESRQAPDGLNLWTLTFDGGKTAGSTLHFDIITLYPTTFHNRPNGLKPNIANTLNDMGATFLRFPGGNNLEGNSADNRWKWNLTIGPLEDRPGRQGVWGYPNTDALGIVEYFEWCEDMNLSPLLAVWAGFSLNSGGDTPITGDALNPYVDDVLNELEFVLGDSSTTYGALRASLGHSDPFPLQHVEIGNEPNLGGGCESYATDRFPRFYNAISAAYPSLTIIAGTDDLTCLPSPVPAGVVLDYHNYGASPELVANFSQFDHYDRSNPLLIGEFSAYASQANDNDEEDPNDNAYRNVYPYMGGSVAEAVYMLGCERNADLIRMSAYAPLLQLFNSTQWTPDLVGFTQDPDGIVRSTSFFVQQMFAQHWGSTTRAIDSDTGFGPVYWGASANEGNGETYVKLANYGNDSQSVSINVAGASAGTLIILSAPESTQNSVEVGEIVKPVISTPDLSDGTFTIQLPAWGVAVLVASGSSSSSGDTTITGASAETTSTATNTAIATVTTQSTVVTDGTEVVQTITSTVATVWETTTVLPAGVVTTAEFKGRGYQNRKGSDGERGSGRHSWPSSHGSVWI